MKSTQNRSRLNDNNRGFAAILIVFVLGMIGLLIAVSSVKTGFLASIMGRAFPESAKAFYFANAGIEDGAYRLNNLDPEFEGDISESYEITFPEGRVQVTITGNINQSEVKAVGYYGKYIRRVTAEFVNTSLSGDDYDKAIHAGTDGLEMDGNTLVTSLDGSGGDVYSNTYINGKSSDHNIAGECRNSSSHIDGKVWSVENIGKMDPGDGVCIDRETYANNLDYCFVNTDVYSPNSPDASCPISGNWNNEPAPTPIPLPEFGEAAFKSYLNSRGDVIEGDCVVGGTPDCTEGTNELGEVIIEGNFEILSNNDFTVTGPIWVKGNLIINSNVEVALDESVENLSQMMVVDGTILSDSDVSFGVNETPDGKAFLLFVSTHTPESSPICDNPSISLSSNTNSVLFYAKYGCILVNSNGEFQGAILGEGIRMEQNSSVTYDPELKNATFGLSRDGSWQIISFSEN